MHARWQWYGYVPVSYTHLDVYKRQDYVRYIERTLKALYEDGIIAGNDLKRMEEDSIIAIRLVDKNVATSRYIDRCV